MTDLLDLSRRFRDLTKAEFDEPELLASLGDGGFLSADGWLEVLRHRRVVLLAEAGSGKTCEMRERGPLPAAVPLGFCDLRDPALDARELLRHLGEAAGAGSAAAGEGGAAGPR